MLKTLRCAAFPIGDHPWEWHQYRIKVTSGSNASFGTNPVAAPQKAPTLIDLARIAYEAYREPGADELNRAMIFGDIATRLGKQAPKRGRQRYITDMTGASKTVVNECIRLAKARPTIEAHLTHLDGAPSKSMSIRGALKLLCSLEKGNVETIRKVRTPAPDALAAMMAKATPDKLRAGFAALDFKACREAFPPEWFKQLDGDFMSQMLRGEKKTGVSVEPPLKSRVVKALQSALSHAKGRNNTDEHEALVALRGINAMLERESCDLHDIGFTVAKPKVVRRRAA